MNSPKSYLRKGKVMLSPALILGILASCSKSDLDTTLSREVTGVDNLTQVEALASTSAYGNILYQEDFESTPFNSYVKTQFTASYSFTSASSPVFAGSKSGRFELRANDAMNNNGTRAEISFPRQSSLDRWYSYAAYFPSKGFEYDSEDECLNQWYQGQHGYSSSISFRIKQDKFVLTVIPKKGVASEKIYLGSVPKDKWVSIVFHIKHSYSSSGLIEMWINGQKVVNRSGANMYDPATDSDLGTPYLKLGIYKSAWNGTQTTSTTTRIMYYDNIRVGSERATYAEMVAGGSTPAPDTNPTEGTTNTGGTTGSTTGSAITGFTLVNAGTEKDVLTITNGMTIGLSQLGVSKLNIRANTGAATVGSVKFELSGAQSKTFIDNAIPFALHGDSGSGNYYYGNWNPPAKGTYTLKATPYSDASGKGTAGTPYSITFTIN